MRARYENEARQKVAVTTLFETTALSRQLLGSSEGGRVKAMTWALFALGVGGAGLAIYGFISGSASLGVLAALSACGTLVFAVGRSIEERRSPHFVIGESLEADLPVTLPGQRERELVLVRAERDGYTLRFTPATRGWLSADGGFAPLSELIATGRALADDSAGAIFALPLPRGAHARVELDQHTIAIESSEGDDALGGRPFAHFSWSSQIFTGLSFVAHMVLLALVFAVPGDGSTMNLDSFGKNNRFVDYLVKPEAEKETDLLKLLKPKSDLRGGEKHRGPEGQSGDKKAPKRKRRLALKGPRDNKHAAIPKALAREAARDAGVLGILKRSSGAITSIFSRSESALGRDVEDAWGNLVADAMPGTAPGFNGFGTTGPGRGGGHGFGDGAGHLIRIGDIGPGTRPNGKWTRGTAKLPTRKRVFVPKLGVGTIVTTPGLDKSIIRRYIRKHLAQFRYCYQRSLQQSPKLQGRVVVNFMISGNGTVTSATIKRSTMSHAPTEQCLARTMRRIAFPAPKGGGVVVVSYPFIFRPAGAH